MLDEIIADPELKKYLITYKAGQFVFLEGDASQDLHILVSGRLDILKGDKKIAELTEIGTLFGEMSFLLGTKRTASVKAGDDVETLCIPKEEINTFLHEFPQVAKEISRHLAERLDETSQVLYGLQEISDKLPDAVILTDRDGNILSWNRSAENLYGWTSHQMRTKTTEDIYADQAEYDAFIEEVQEKHTINERTLKIRHPKKGERFISTSTTLLHDAHQNYQGVLSLGRDVTDLHRMNKRYRQFRNWFIPILILVAMSGGILFYFYPEFVKQQLPLSEKQHELRNQMAKDSLFLKSMLNEPLKARGRGKILEIMKEFFAVQEAETTLYTGLVLLDENLKVYSVYSRDTGTDTATKVGSSYGGISFKGDEDAIHRVLTLYRVDEDHPMGRRGIEVAFEMKDGDLSLGWLVFQMDTEMLQEKYGLDDKGLKRFHFTGP